jgi:hypothetical protein
VIGYLADAINAMRKLLVFKKTWTRSSCVAADHSRSASPDHIMLGHWPLLFPQ